MLATEEADQKLTQVAESCINVEAAEEDEEEEEEDDDEGEVKIASKTKLKRK